MKLDFDNSRTRQEGLLLCPGEAMEQPSLEALFADFYQRQNGRRWSRWGRSWWRKRCVLWEVNCRETHPTDPVCFWPLCRGKNALIFLKSGVGCI